MFVELAPELFAVAERDIDRAEVDADLVFDLDRVRAAIAFLDPELLGQEDPFGEIRAVAEFGAEAFAAAFLTDDRSIGEGVEIASGLAGAGVTGTGAGFKAESVADIETG